MFVEVKKELDHVPSSPKLLLARHMYCLECESAWNKEWMSSGYRWWSFRVDELKGSGVDELGVEVIEFLSVDELGDPLWMSLG
ncbi:hypothetical protein HA466_0248420 [Hirschfeldia incana]|nr:hypothetical protein HA466_0248420 [Hirschfeldia incana]